VAAAALLTILASGPKEAYDACLPAFEAMGKFQFHVGEGEEARYLKLTLNMMVGTSAAMVGEALTFGERGGMDWQQMLDIIDASVVASPLVKYKIQALKDRDYAPAFTAAQMGKDFDLALDAARQMDVPMPLTAQVRQNWSAMKANGKGELDFFAYVALLEEIAGIRPG
jgi:3-hydroxyisobutyrate dehydrogenase-like beta-hydroxyacid dehydrogenase